MLSDVEEGDNLVLTRLTPVTTLLQATAWSAARFPLESWSLSPLAEKKFPTGNLITGVIAHWLVLSLTAYDNAGYSLLHEQRAW